MSAKIFHSRMESIGLENRVLQVFLKKISPERRIQPGGRCGDVAKVFLEHSEGNS